MDRRTSLLVLRWVATLTLGLLLAYSGPLTHGALAVCLVLALSNAALHLAPPAAFRRQRLHFLVFVLDLILVSVAVYLADASEIAFFAVLLLGILSGAVTGDARASFLLSLFGSVLYLAQVRVSVLGFADLLDPGTLLRVPLLLVFSLTAALLARGAERTTRRRAESLLALHRRISFTMSPEEMARTAAGVLTERAGYRRAALYLVEPDQVTLRRAGDPTFPEVLDLGELDAAAGGRLKRGLAVHPQHLAAAPDLGRRLGLAPRAGVVLPAQFSERPLGLLVAEHRRPVIDPEPEVAFLCQLAEHAASAIMTARMIQTAQESAIGLHSLLKMSEDVSSSLRIRDVLALLDDFCRRLVGARACRLWATPAALGPSAREGAAGVGLTPLGGGEPTPLEQAAARRVLETGSELFLNTPEAVEALAPGAGVANLMALPLRTATEVLGVLEAIDKPGPFHQRDHSLLAGLASQATIALVNARLYEGLEERAARIGRLNGILAAEKQKLEHVLGNMEEGVVVLEREGRVALANHAGRRLLAPRGRPAFPAPAARFADPLGLLPRLGAVLAAGTPLRETLPHGERYFELAAARLPGGDSVIAVFRDITELVRTNALRSEFVSHVSHELRTPLAAIVGSIRLIIEGRAGELSDTQRRLLGIVERESGRLMQLINDLLDLAKLEAGRTAVEREEADLGALVAEAMESLASLADSKSIRLAADCERLAGPVPCDPGLVRQVLTNLIGNALKFTPAGGSVRIEAATGPAAAEVRVIDTGIGIPRDKWEAVFDKFEQLGGRTAPGKGTGLGLAICRQIIERHGGSIAAESEEGAGSTFRFTLPLGEAIGEAELTPAA